MRNFNPELKENESTIRIGNTVPPGSVNLAFVSAPSLSSDKAVQVFDYSASIPENNKPLSNLKTNLYVDKNGILINDAGVAKFPLSDIKMTNEYYRYEDPKREPVPLFYRYVSRFYHYEEGVSGTENRFEYTGQNISIVSNSVAPIGPHKIYLNKKGTNIYEVEVFSSFATNETLTYHLRYKKYDGGKVNPSHQEVMNSTFAFTETTLDKLADYNYAVENAPNYDGYYFNVGYSATEELREPVLFRWRLKYNSIVTPWKSEYLLEKESMRDTDYTNHVGDTVYHDDEVGSHIVSKKQIAKSPESVFQTMIPENFYNMTMEVQVWNGTTWSSDDESIVSKGELQYNSPIYVWINPNSEVKTGQPQSFIGRFFQEYPSRSLAFKISGRSIYTQHEHTPEQIINHARLQRGATASWGNEESGWKNIYGKLIGVDNVIRGSTRLLFSSILGYAWGRTKEGKGSYPDHSRPEIIVTLDTPKSLDHVEVVMGSAGDIYQVELLDNNGAVKWQGKPVQTKTSLLPYRRHFRQDFPSQISNIKRIRVIIQPESKKVKDYWWILNLFGVKDKYIGEWDVYEINAVEVIPEGTKTDENIWAKSKEYTVSVSKNSRYRQEIRSLIFEDELYPSDLDLRENCVYNIELIDSNDCNIKLVDNSGTKYVNTLGEWNLTYQEATRSGSRAPIIEGTTDAYEVYGSRQFTIDNSLSPNIFIDEDFYYNEDQMWHLPIRNGRIDINDMLNKEKRQYYIPEFGLQAFDPELGLPYMTKVKEQAEFVDNRVVRVPDAPLKVILENGQPNNLKVYQNNVEVPVLDWDIHKGEIYLGRDVEYNDTLHADYSFEQRSFVYKGFADVVDESIEFYHLDLNPLPGHTYTDLQTKAECPSSELLNKAIYLYIMPAYIQKQHGETLVQDDSSVIRHAIYPKETSETTVRENLPQGAFLLGKVLITPTIAPSDAIVLDSRMRGGGVAEDVSLDALKLLNEEATYFWDIGSWDGTPYPSNGVVILTLPQDVLRRSSEDRGLYEEEIRNLIKNYVAFGVHVIIRYK